MSSKIFLDTAPIIYFLEGHKEFGPKVADFLQKELAENSFFITSQITNTEFLPPVFRGSDSTGMQKFNEFISALNMQFIDIDKSISVHAAKIRGTYEHIKTADAIQLATAIISQCNVFLTNDKQLKQVKEISVTVVAEL